MFCYAAEHSDAAGRRKGLFGPDRGAALIARFRTSRATPSRNTLASSLPLAGAKAMTGSSSDLVPPPRQVVDAMTQSRYERAFQQELGKIEQAIVEQRQVKQSLQDEITEEQSRAQQKKTWDHEKARRLASMEKAIAYADEQNTKRFLEKRAAVTKRIQQQEALAEEKRQQAREQMQQHLAEQARGHAERMARVHAARAAAMEKVRRDAEKREAQLGSRLASEQQEREVQTAKKAEDAVKKVQHAADQRAAMIEQQRAKHREKEAALQQRIQAQKQQQEDRAAANRAAAERKMQDRARAIEKQRVLERERLDKVVADREQRLQQLQVFEAKVSEARRQQQVESLHQQAAARERSERALGSLQAELAEREDANAARMAKVDRLQLEREQEIEYCRLATRRLAADRANLSNSIVRLRTATNMASSDPSLAIDMPKERRRAVQDIGLSTLFDRVDPYSEGRIALPLVKKRLGKMLQQPQPTAKRAIGGIASPYAAVKPSKSMPSLLPSDKGKPASLHDKCVEAFKSCDTDGSGTISKRELITVLRSMGLKDTKNALQLFDGFDADGNAELCAAADLPGR